jgi:hypothetical protein
VEENYSFQEDMNIQDEKKEEITIGDVKENERGDSNSLSKFESSIELMIQPK